MNDRVWITIGLLWLSIAVSLTAMYRTRHMGLAGNDGSTGVQLRIGLAAVLVIVAIYATVYALGYSSGKARALAENRADALMAIN